VQRECCSEGNVIANNFESRIKGTMTKKLLGVEGTEFRKKLVRVRRREIAHFALPRRNFVPLFYGVSEIRLLPFKIPP
jgi:hypothetical protein